MRALSVVAFACVLGVACSSFDDSDAVPPGGDGGPGGGGDANANDGGGGESDGGGGVDGATDAGRTVAILATQQRTLSVAASETNVVWGDDDGYVRFMNLDATGSPSAIHTGGSPNHVRYDGADILWSDHGTDPTQGLFRDKSGSTNRFYTGKATNFASYGADYVVFSLAEGFVRRVTSSGVEQKSWGPYNGLHDMIEDGGDVLFTHSGGVARLAAGAADPTLLVGESDCRSLAVDANAIYWAKGSDSIRRRDRMTGAVTDFAIEPGIHALAADASGVYWQVEHAVHRKAGTAIVTLAEGFTSTAYDLDRSHHRQTALTSKYVVWATDTEIRRVEK